MLRDKRFSSFHAAYHVFRFTQDVHPLKIKYDNALTFEQAANEERIRTLVHETKWEFNPPGAAWWGGFYERLVKMIKQKLVLCFGKQKFSTFEDFRVAVTYLEWLLNNRPIYVSKEKGDEFLSIHPGQFINYGHQDNYFRMMENILSERSETPVGGKMLTEIQKTQTKFQRRLKRVFDTYYINILHPARRLMNRPSRACRVKQKLNCQYTMRNVYKFDQTNSGLFTDPHRTMQLSEGASIKIHAMS